VRVILVALSLSRDVGHVILSRQLVYLRIRFSRSCCVLWYISLFMIILW